MTGTGGTFALTATGTSPITFALDGTEPAGVSIVGGNLVVTNAIAAGVYTFDITASNVTTIDDVQTFTLTVDAPVAPTITSAASFTCVAGTGGSFALTATGTAPITWSLAGAPAGVTIVGATLNVAASVAAGTYNLTITASNVTSNNTQNFTLTVTTPTVTPPTGTAPRITGPSSLKLNTGYAATSTEAFTISGTPWVDVTKISGDAKITWNSATYCLDIAQGLTEGIYPVVLRATNSIGSFTFTFTLTVKGKVYYLDIPLSYPGGTVTASSGMDNPWLAAEGQTVTLTITPDAGYELVSINVYNYGTTTAVALSGTGLTRTFTMPANHITVVAVFRLIKTSVEDVVNNNGMNAFVENGVLYVSGLTIGKAWNVYNVLGTLIYQGIAADVEAEVALPGRGVYIVTDGERVIKVTN